MNKLQISTITSYNATYLIKVQGLGELTLLIALCELATWDLVCCCLLDSSVSTIGSWNFQLHWYIIDICSRHIASWIFNKDVDLPLWMLIDVWFLNSLYCFMNIQQRCLASTLNIDQCLILELAILLHEYSTKMFSLHFECWLMFDFWTYPIALWIFNKAIEPPLWMLIDIWFLNLLFKLKKLKFTIQDFMQIA
jgi:hypothetical protein